MIGVGERHLNSAYIGDLPRGASARNCVSMLHCVADFKDMLALHPFDPYDPWNEVKFMSDLSLCFTDREDRRNEVLASFTSRG